jgi:uncharacterized protein YbbC (DUF1343 family)
VRTKKKKSFKDWKTIRRKIGLKQQILTRESEYKMRRKKKLIKLQSWKSSTTFQNTRVNAVPSSIKARRHSSGTLSPYLK